jgi:ABC-2 type transport system ATP-binding protein
VIEILFERVNKTFGGGLTRTRAVVDGTWSARGGEIFGLLGPNGAGKTTAIRMILDMLRPDDGAIRVNGVAGGNQSTAFRHRVGYLPEERGLYRKRRVMETLVYLGALKGLRPVETQRRAGQLLARFGLSEYAKRKIGVLSKGMAQKLQILSTVMHDPDLVILDEPFSGLDPVNVRIVRELVAEMRAKGKLVILSTHMMAEVEALCDRILLIHHGRQVLYGGLADVKKQHTDFDVLVDAETNTDGLGCVARVAPTATGKRIWLASGKTVSDLMVELGQKKRRVRLLEEGALPIEDIFVAVVGEKPVATLARPAGTETAA